MFSSTAHCKRDVGPEELYAVSSCDRYELHL